MRSISIRALASLLALLMLLSCSLVACDKGGTTTEDTTDATTEETTKAPETVIMAESGTVLLYPCARRLTSARPFPCLSW